MQDDLHAEEAASNRFSFGRNWTRFLTTMSEQRISHAERDIAEMLDVDDLTHKTFLDIGSGSGLSSLAARRLGARVHSFDYDPLSVACTTRLRARYFPDDPSWSVEHGSVLNKAYLESLGQYDIVYAWGVLHHTGDLWRALAHAAERTRTLGCLFVAIYNDQGRKSGLWKRIKRFYCSGLLSRAMLISVFFPYYTFRTVLSSVVRGENIFSSYSNDRGMSIFYDWFDWLGGHPFEVASADAVFSFLKSKGFRLHNMRTVNGGHGNNQFVFIREPDDERRLARISHAGPANDMPGGPRS